jgi:hypothetical protein
LDKFSGKKWLKGIIGKFAFGASGGIAANTYDRVTGIGRFPEPTDDRPIQYIAFKPLFVDDDALSIIVTRANNLGDFFDSAAAPRVSANEFLDEIPVFDIAIKESLIFEFFIGQTPYGEVFSPGYASTLTHVLLINSMAGRFEG